MSQDQNCCTLKFEVDILHICLQLLYHGALADSDTDTGTLSLAVAFMEQILDEVMEFQLGSVCSKAVRRYTGLRQGGPKSNHIWQHAFDRGIVKIVEKWEKTHYGVKVGNKRIHNMHIADDVWIIAPNVVEGGYMCQDFSNTAKANGLDLSMTKIGWSTNVLEWRADFLNFGAVTAKSLNLNLKGIVWR